MSEHGGVLEHRALGAAQAVQTGGDEGVQGLGNVELGDVGGQHVARAVLDEQPTVEQHPYRLDRVQRHPLGAAQDPAGQLVGQPGHETVERLAHRFLAQRFEHDRALRPRRSGVEQLAPAASRG